MSLEIQTLVASAPNEPEIRGQWAGEDHGARRKTETLDSGIPIVVLFKISLLIHELISYQPVCFCFDVMVLVLVFEGTKYKSGKGKEARTREKAG